jgi:hypothetical protein
MKIIAAALFFAASCPAADAAFADQPMPYTEEPTQKVSKACNLDSPNGLDEGLDVGEMVYSFRKCFQKAGYDFDKSILHFASDYGNNPQSFNDPRRMVSGITIGLPVQDIAVQAQKKKIDLHRYFPADEVAAIARVAEAASNMKKRWEEDTAAIGDEWAVIDLKNAYTAAVAIAAFRDDFNVKVTTELLTQNGYKPTDGVRLAIINGTVSSLKMTASHKLGGTTFEIDAHGNISKR